VGIISNKFREQCCHSFFVLAAASEGCARLRRFDVDPGSFLMLESSQTLRQGSNGVEGRRSALGGRLMQEAERGRRIRMSASTVAFQSCGGLG